MTPGKIKSDTLGGGPGQHEVDAVLRRLDRVRVRRQRELGLAREELLPAVMDFDPDAHHVRHAEPPQLLFFGAVGAPGWIAEQSAANSASFSSGDQLRKVPQGARKDVRGRRSHSASTSSP